VGYYRSHKQILLFHGVPFNIAEITQPTPSRAMMWAPKHGYFDYGAIGSVAGPDMDCYLRLWATVPMDLAGSWDCFLAELYHEHRDLVALGSGLRCPYCGGVALAGLTRCPYCGGDLAKEKFLSVGQFPFRVSASDVADPGIRIDDLALVELELATRDLDINLFADAVTVEALPSSFSLDSDKFLCEHCGTIVDKGRTCPGCGGVRLPWSEVVKIDHDCIYCGQHTDSGIVCPGCGAAMAAMSYKALRGQYDLQPA
jgi:hypothetical protein